MKDSLSRFFGLKIVQIKQLWKHKARTIMLLISLSFSFTLLLVSVFTTVNFGKYTYWMSKSEAEMLIYRTDNTIKNDNNEPAFTSEGFAAMMEQTKSNELIEDSIFFYEPIEFVESQYRNEKVNINFFLFEDEDMHMSPANSSKTKALQVDNFLFGGFPKSEQEIALNERTIKMYGIELKTLKKDKEPIIKINNKDYKLTGVIHENGLLDYPGIMYKSSYEGEVRLSFVSFTTGNQRTLKELKDTLVSKGIVLDVTPDDGLVTNFMLIIECVLIILTFSITLVTMLMYYSNFRSLIKECEKQTCLSYYLGYTKKQTIIDMLFKLCFIGTIAFLLATVFSSLIGLWVSNQKSLVFGGMPLYKIALPDFLGFIIGYLIAMPFIILLFYYPIKKSVLKLPNSFGGNV